MAEKILNILHRQGGAVDLLGAMGTMDTGGMNHMDRI